MDILKRIAAELDAAVDEIQDPRPVARDIAGVVDLDYRPKLQGKALGLCIAIAILNSTNMEYEREQAWIRWAERQD